MQSRLTQQSITYTCKSITRISTVTQNSRPTPFCHLKIQFKLILGYSIVDNKPVVFPYSQIIASNYYK